MDAHTKRDVVEGPTSPGKEDDIGFHGRDDVCDPVKMSADKDVPAVGRGKYKKKPKWLWRWKHKDPRTETLTQFSHDPPGHTCGLPCCSHDNEPQQAVQPPSQRGCVPIPALSQAELSESNFVMKRKESVCPGKTKVTQCGTGDIRDGALRPISGDERVMNKAGLGGIHVSKESVLSSELIGVNKAELTNDMHYSLQHRKHEKVSPLEQMRQRHITLPDCPQTQHTIKFLNYQPGETSDFSDTEMRQAHDATGPETRDLNATLTTDQNISPHLLSEGNVASDGDLDNRKNIGGVTYRKRLAHSKLPEVPVEAPSLSTGSGVKQVLFTTDEGDAAGDASIMDDHVYDVLSEVKETAEKLSLGSTPVNFTSVVDQDLSCSALDGTKLELPNSDIDSLTYQGSASDSNTGSYIYNGSLLSHGTNDTDSFLPYPNHRYIIGNSDYHAALLRHGHSNGRSSYPNNFIQGRYPHITSGSQIRDMQDHSEDKIDIQSHGSATSLDIQKSSIQVDEYDINNKRHLAVGRDTSWLDLDTSVSSGLDLDNGTKMRLWDLKLITINREQNHYSTFPLRKLTTDDVSLGHFNRTHNLGYVHRHNSDVSTDHYVTHKIKRILRAPILTKYFPVEHPTALNFVDHCQIHPFQSPESLDSWKQFFKDKQQAMELNSSLVRYDITDPAKQLLPSWTHPWKSTHEPITLSEIYKHGALFENDKHNKNSHCCKDDITSRSQGGRSSSIQRAFSPSPPTDSSVMPDTSSLRAEASLKDSFPGRADNKSRSESDYGGKMDRSVRCANTIVSQQTGDLQNKGRGPATWRPGGLVDWRRQAQIYRDNNFITLIL